MSFERPRPRPVNSYVGSPVERIEDLRFLRGRGRYVDDVSRPGMLHAFVLRSTFAHGRIQSIEPTAALAIPGVHAVITAADIGSVPTIPLRQEQLAAFRPFEQPVIAVAKVRYVGEPLAVIVADSAAIAEDAADAVAVDIAALAVVADRAAAERGSVLLFEESPGNVAATLTAVKGDADAAFRDAPYVRREHFKVQRHTAVPMEPRGLAAEWDGGRLTVHGAAKVAFPNRRILARQMGLAEDAIRMVENDVGGGFGVRGEFYPEDFLIPFAARLTGRPVKWIEDRREHLIATNHARDVACDLEIACDARGAILGLRGRACADVGAYMRTNGATGARNTAQILSGPYRVPNIRIEVALLLTNKTPVGTYRGPGRFEADFFRERLFEMAAGDLGIDPAEFRRRNLLGEAEQPYALAKVVELDLGGATDSGDYRMTFERCLAEIGWAARSALQGRLIDGRYHGLAVGCYFEGGASGPKEMARLALQSDGSVSVHVGSSANGQGLETAFAQIAADALEMPIERICRVLHGSTDLVPEGFGTYSSRSIVMGGSAIIAAAGTFTAAIRTAAAQRLGCDTTEVEVADGAARARGRSVPLSDLAAAGISADGSYASSHRTYSYGAHAAHVAVDARTGHVAVLDYVAVEDVGRIINPAMLHGQTVGAIVQGLGGTFLEHLVYDEQAQLMTGSLADYLMPTASDFPVVRAVALEEKPAPHNPLGAKGAGEGGIIPVGGVIANAVAAALRPLGVEPRELPLSPPRLWHLIAAAPRPDGSNSTGDGAEPFGVDGAGLKGLQMKEWVTVLKAADAAARWHVHQRRKGAAKEPYINHLLEVAMLVAQATGGSDPSLVISALLHDAIEDCEVPYALIAEAFGNEVADVVAEVTDDKTLEKAERKKRQVEDAHKKSKKAKMLKLADKTSNLRALVSSPAPDWSVRRRSEYIDWASKVVDGLRGVNPLLESQFDEAAQAARQSLVPKI